MQTRRDLLQQLAAGAAAASLPGAPAGALENPPAQTTEKHPMLTRSDVGSFFPFVESQKQKGEFPLSFLRPEFAAVADWKPRARGKLLDLLHYAPERCDPRAETLEKADCGDHIRERILFNTTPDLRIPAYVLAPKKPGRHPAIVALHDHGGFYLYGKEKLVELPDEHPVLTRFKEQYYGGVSTASALARQGYVVVVIDMFYWGERRLLLDDDPDDWRSRPREITAERISAYNQRSSQSEQLLGRTLYSAGLTWSGVMFWDDVRTVDYLISRPDVDPSRIGCVGLSVGALRSCHLAALDDRIKAAVVVGWMASFPAQLRSHIRNTIGFTKLVPGLYRHLDYPDVASLAMPSALLVINGSKDGLFDLDGLRACFDKLAACYRKAGIAEKVRTRMYDTPHEFNREMQAEAWEWLKRWV
jgi:dienelactone hydrolase